MRKRTIICAVLLAALLLPMLSACGFGGSDALEIENISAQILEDGTTRITIKYFDNLEAPVIFDIPKGMIGETGPQGERGEEGNGIKEIQITNTEIGEQVMKIYYTDAEHPVTEVTVKDGVNMPVPQAFRLLAALIPARHNILLKDTLGGAEVLSAPMAAGLNVGSLLCDGIGNAVLIRREADPEKAAYLAYNVLQAAGVRLSKTEYVSCPSCGRTLYNIQEASARIRKATGHLKGVKIAIMGCIVNGPGEMSDADFGYVGGAPNKINLYVGHTPVEFNIPQEEAVERLIELIRSHGRWVDPS